MLDQLQTNGVPESRTDVLVRFPENDRKHRDLGGVAEAGELLQCRLGFDGQAGQHHVVGVALGADAIDVPLPGWCDWVEREQLLLGQLREELDREERISAGLLLHQLR